MGSNRGDFSIIEQLKRDFTDLIFQPADDFSWSPGQRTVFYAPVDSQLAVFQLLHEVAHGLLGHQHYQSDIQLLEMERQAWEYVCGDLAERYGYSLGMDNEIVQENLDTYREWLHCRSACPDCAATGLQSSADVYRCLNCQTNWRVNDAKKCRLKRQKLN